MESNPIIKRAAQSIPANIAEGHGRYHFLDNVRFCYIALAHDLGYLSDDTYKRMTSYPESIAKQLNNYIAYLKRSKQGEKEYPAGYTLREESKPYLIDYPEEDNPND